MNGAVGDSPCLDEMGEGMSSEIVAEAVWWRRRRRYL